ncbi:MAG: hypothetical protein V4760_11915 [Bdellovibrionota bacterium]
MEKSVDTDFVKVLQIKRPEELLQELVRQFEKAEGNVSRFPFVTVTCGIHRHFGIPVKIESINGDPMLALLEPEAGMNQRDALTFLKVKSVEIVTIMNLSNVVDILTGGRDSVTADAPTQLIIEREVARLKGVVEAKVGHPVTIAVEWNGASDDPKARNSIFELLLSLKECIAHISADPVGLDSLRAIQSWILRYSPGVPLAIERVGEKLVISFGAATKARVLKDELKVAIEAQL